MTWHVRGVVLPEDSPEGGLRDLWLVGDRVTFEPQPGAVTLADHGFVLPGLVDAHCHIGIQAGGAPNTELDRIRELAGIDRDAGVFALRDAGSPTDYAALDDDPDLPRLARAGRHVARPRRYLRDLAVEVEQAQLVPTVVEQAGRGNGWVKVVGDWIDRDLGDLGAAWSARSIQEAVAAVHARGARVAVHAFAEESVVDFVAAGVDSVEHGTGLDDAAIAAMARQHTALVPTMINIDTFEKIAAQADGKFPAYAAHMRRLQRAFPEVVARAHEAGVPIYVGTDAGGGIAHGRPVDEMLALHERAGLPIIDVLAAGSWGARQWLGFAGLVEGGLADLLVFDADPRLDLRVLREPRVRVLRGVPRGSV